MAKQYQTNRDNQAQNATPNNAQTDPTASDVNIDLSKVVDGLIFQQVNAAGVMGKGLAKALRDAYPEVYDQYMTAYREAPPSDADTFHPGYRGPLRIKHNLSGQLQEVKINDNLSVFNSFSQADFGRGGHFTNEEQLLNNLRRATEIANERQTHLYVPLRVGSGLAGGNEQQIVAGIRQLQRQYPGVIVVSNPDAPSRQVQQDSQEQAEEQERSNSEMAETQNQAGNGQYSFEEKPITGQRMSLQNAQSPAVKVIHPMPEGRDRIVMSLTGVRPGHLAKGNANLYDSLRVNDPNNPSPWQPVYDRLVNIIQQQVQAHPNATLELHSGMAEGADMVWAQAIVDVKRMLEQQGQSDRIRFVADIPTSTQSDVWWQDGYTGTRAERQTEEGRQQIQSRQPELRRRHRQLLHQYDQLVDQWRQAQQAGNQQQMNQLNQQISQLRIPQPPLLYHELLQQVDAYALYGKGYAGGAVMEARNQGMMMNADQGIVVGTQSVFDPNSGLTNSGTRNGMADMERFGVQIPNQNKLALDTPEFGFEDNHDGHANRRRYRRNDNSQANYSSNNNSNTRQSQQPQQGSQSFQSYAANAQQAQTNDVSNVPSMFGAQEAYDPATRGRDERVEYVMTPTQGREHHQYIVDPDAYLQTRYGWREPGVAEQSPVTVNELMKILSPAIASPNNKNAMRQILKKSLSASVPQIDNKTGKTVDFTQIVSSHVGKHNYDLSPSNVQTILTVLTAVNDLGLDYDVQYDARNHSVNLRLKNNNSLMITLIDPKEPQRVGQIKTRDDTHWVTSLGRLRYMQKDDQGQPDLDTMAAIGASYRTNENGEVPRNQVKGDDPTLPTLVKGQQREEDMSPVDDNGFQFNETEHYRVNATRVTDIKPIVRSGTGQPELSQMITRARYAGLDQSTKNKLALASLINAIGADPNSLSPRLRKDVMNEDGSPSTIMTMDTLGDSKTGYQAAVNMGQASNANISRVVNVINNPQNHADSLAEVTPTFLHGGDVVVDLSSASEIVNNTLDAGIVGRLNPTEITPETADTMTMQAYHDARINWLNRLTDSDQSSVDEQLGKDQRKFRKILMNEVVDRTEELQGVFNETKMHYKRREMLDLDSQQYVLGQFTTGILDAGFVKAPNSDPENTTEHLTAIDDNPLMTARANVVKSTNDPVLRSRRLEVFDDLVRMFDNKFGTAPLQNQVPVENNLGLTPQEYRDRLEGSMDMSTDAERDARGKEFDAALNQYQEDLKQLVGEDHFNPDLMNYSFADQRKLIQRDLLDRTDEVNEVQRQNIMGRFDDLTRQFEAQFPLKNVLNVSNVIEETESRANSVDYEFKLAKASQKSRYHGVVGGVNGLDLQRTMERSVEFDNDSAMTIDQLRAQDKDPNSPEGKLQAYIQDVKSGKKDFSFTDPDNPNPAAFKSTENGDLINPVSPNEEKAQLLERVQKQLAKRGADPKSINVMIDKNGVISFKANLPLYNIVWGQPRTTGADYQRDENGNVKYGDPTKSNSVYAQKNASPRGQVRYQPISGTIGQVFVRDHDGMVRTNFYRYPGYDQSAGQKTLIPRTRGIYQLLDVDENGNYIKSQLQNEAKNGLGLNNRLIGLNYEVLLNRELDQAVTNLISTKNVGNVSHYNSNTIMNKLYRGGMLADQAPMPLLNAPVDHQRQVKLESRERAWKFSDNVAAATKFTEVIGFMKNFDAARDELRKRAIMRGENHGKDWPDKYDVEVFMHSPITNYGNASIGEVSRMENLGLFSATMTGQGGAFGTEVYEADGVTHQPDGHVIPAGPKDKDGNPIYDQDGKMVRFLGTVPIEREEAFNGAYKNAPDRNPVGKDQAMKGHQMTPAHVASMALGAWTQEDGMVISEEFAKRCKIKDTTGKVRPLMVGDKISDGAGNKATISMIVHPDMDPAKADEQGIGDIVAMFKQNPDLEVVMNGMSQLSRNNGSTADAFINNESSAPMKFRRMVKDKNGNYVPGPEVQTNASINLGDLTITDQTVDHKVTLYEDAGDKGRKSGGLGGVSDLSKGATKVASYFRKSTNGILTFRQHLLASGLDFDGKSLYRANFDALIDSGQAKSFTYDISKNGMADLTRALDDQPKNFKPDPKATEEDRFMKLATNSDGSQVYKLSTKSLSKYQFTGLDNQGQLTSESSDFLEMLTNRINRFGRIAVNDEEVKNGFYNPGRDFLNQLPDGGVLQLPEGVTYQIRHGQRNEGATADKVYILPEKLRMNTRSLDGRIVRSNFNRMYAELGTKLAKYKLIHHEVFDRHHLDGGNPELKAAVEQKLANSLGIQNTLDRIAQESQKIAFGDQPKHSEFNQNVLSGRVKDSVTSQVSSNPNLPLDVIEVSPEIAKKLGFTARGDKDGFAHMRYHQDWTMLHVHRDPIWREQGSLAFRVKINPDITNVRISPVMSSMMDGDFDGDNLGLIAMKGDDVQQELKDKCSVDHWMLDNNGVNDFANAHSLLNINAEVVDSAVRTNQTYIIEGPDGKKAQFKLFDHAKDKNGNNLPLAQDTSLKKTLMSFMKQVRPDVLPKEFRDSKGNLDEAKAMKLMDDPKKAPVNDSDILNMAVDNVIKNNYAMGRKQEDPAKRDAYDKRARLSVEYIVQTARGYDVSLGKHDDLLLAGGKTSQLVNDGVNYKNEETMKASLRKYINEGAKGSENALQGLLEYMHQPTMKELDQMGKAQMADGKLDEKLHEQYMNVINDLADRTLAVQRATKEKSDITGVPGNIQKMITAVLINAGKTPEEGERGLHAANAIGQAGTQKVLSIKRDPLMAAKVAEILQGPINDLLDGQRPTSHPLFALVGGEADGHLGNDTLTVADRVAKLNEYPFSNGRTLENQAADPLDWANSEAGKQQLVNMAEYVGIKVPEDAQAREHFLQGFAQTVHDVKTPYVPDKGPNAILKTTDPNVPLTKEEFVNAMDYLYNDQMGLDVDRKNIELLADVAADSNGNMRSIKQATSPDYTGNNVLADWANSMAKLQQGGLTSIEHMLSTSKDSSCPTPMGQEGSVERSLYLGGLTDKELDQARDLNQTENPFESDFGRDKKRESKSEKDAHERRENREEKFEAESSMQNDMLGAFHTEVNDLVRKMEVDAASARDSQKELEKAASQNAKDSTAVSVSTSTSSSSASLSELDKESEDLMGSLNAEVDNVSDSMPTSQAATSYAPLETGSVASTIADSDAVNTSSARSNVRRNNRVNAENSATSSAASIANDLPKSVQAAADSAKSSIQPSSGADNKKPAHNFNALESDIFNGNYRQSPFNMQIGKKTVTFNTANQYVAFKYYEKAYRSGVFTNRNDAAQMAQSILKANDQDGLNKVQTELVKLANKTGHTDLFTKADDAKFFGDAMMGQAMSSMPAMVQTINLGAKVANDKSFDQSSWKVQAINQVASRLQEGFNKFMGQTVPDGPNHPDNNDGGRTI